MEEETAFQNLARSRKKGAARDLEEAAGRQQQASIRALPGDLPGERILDRAAFVKVLDRTARETGVKLAAPLRKAIVSALSERREQAEICRDREGHPEPDPELRDTESVPLAESAEDFF